MAIGRAWYAGALSLSHGMVYFEFACAGSPSLRVATADRDPAHIPDAALACCEHWEFASQFRLGDGSHTTQLDAAIRARVADDGFHIFKTPPED